MNYYQEWKKAKSIMGSPLVGRKIEEVINDFAAWLKESDTPTHDFTDIEREAAELYPYDEKGDGRAMITWNQVEGEKRAAHISCAQSYEQKVKGLEAEVAAWKDASQLYFKYLSPETKEIIRQYYEQSETHSQTNNQQP
jgi:hypothetical protein